MRFAVQKYDPVSGRTDDIADAEVPTFADQEQAEVCGLLMKNVYNSINDKDVSNKFTRRQPTVRFHDPEDVANREELEELTALSNNDEQPATVRPTADRRASAIQDKMAKRGRQYAHRYLNRVVFKDGTCNIVTKNILQRKRRYLVDIFTTFVDMKWRYSLILFAVAFVGSWLAFASVSILAGKNSLFMYTDDLLVQISRYC
jgi:Inward rectifier potassium channel transmembrane domain